jgi:hypothetical protein
VVSLFGKGMIVLVKQKLDRTLIAGIVRNKQVGGVSDKNAFPIKNTPALKHPDPSLSKPVHQGLGIRILGYLP